MNTASQMPPLNMVPVIAHVERHQDQTMVTRCPPGQCQVGTMRDAAKPAYQIMQEWLESEGLV